MTVFYLGTHRPGWLADSPYPLFVSDRRLRQYTTLPIARCNWAVDSGGFTELQKYGEWRESALEYARRVRRYRAVCTRLDFAAPQDWMCEPIIINGGQAGGRRFTGTRRMLDPYGKRTTAQLIREHQLRTVTNLLELRVIAPDLPWIPVLQGWTTSDYLRCASLYQEVGVDLTSEPVVGIGSVCRRQGTRDATEIISAVSEALPGIRIHGFGVKITGLAAYGDHLHSADSMAWSFAARKARRPLCGRQHPRGGKTCANCVYFASDWRKHVLGTLAEASMPRAA